MTYSLVTVVIPVAAARADSIDSVLDTWGNPIRPDLQAELDKGGVVHFMSIGVIRADPRRAFLLMEISADGDRPVVLGQVEQVIGDPLRALLSAAEVGAGNVPLAAFLGRHCIDVGTGWFSTSGVVFAGIESMTVGRIRAEAMLAAELRQVLASLPIAGDALTVLDTVRRSVSRRPDLAWALQAEPTPILDGPRGTLVDVLPGVIAKGVWTFLWPVIVPLTLIGLLTFGYLWHQSGIALAAGASAAAFLLIALLTTVVAVIGYRAFRAAERTDQPDDTDPSAVAVAEILGRENVFVQNHLTGVSIVKPGFLRRLALRTVFYAIGELAARVYRPGQLGTLKSIHFARWVVLPGTDKLVFLSNYDGSWESYLEDFITQAHAGLTGVWSNTVGFPKTANLVQQGATDGDRFKRWARRYQQPSRCWYSAYPTLTTNRIRTNAAIRQGLAAAALGIEAADWLACFGSASAPAVDIDAPSIQTLVFGGLGRHPFAMCLLARLSGGPAPAKAWLQELSPLITFDRGKFQETVHIVSFSGSGLGALGLVDRHLATFPAAFQQGMAAPWRSRLLGDVGQNDPSRWWWGGTTNSIDAAILIYSKTPEALADSTNHVRDRLSHHGHECVKIIPLATQPPPEAPSPEPFGFEDGISQPVIRGVRVAWPGDRDHIVEPGEMILGYPDDRGYIPLALRVSASDDPNNILPGVNYDPQRQRPNAVTVQPNVDRDMGRNGTFLVIRQLEQNVKKFNQAIKEAAYPLRHQSNLPVPMDLLEGWIAAKMIGRWKNGASLVRSPMGPTKVSATALEKRPYDRPDNEFRFGEEDPIGMRCPFGAHIRRANPRDAFDPGSEEQISITNRHRILRVGRPYVPEHGGADPGLLFMCVNADIQRQFEFLQQTWLLGSSFQGLENEVDPVLGIDPNASGRFNIPMSAGHNELANMKDFVTVRGGGYFFVPGREALHFLGQH